MKENKVRCTRCKAEVSFMAGTLPGEARRLGWVGFGVYTSGDFILAYQLCPHCAHEGKRFLAGCEIRKLND